MWFKRLSNYLLAHPYVALPIMFLLTSSTQIDAFKVVPLIFVLMLGGAFSLTFAGLVTLLKGELLGACFMGAVTLPYLVKLGALFQSSNAASFDWMMVIGITFSCLLNLLIWIVACMIRRGYSWGTIMQSMTLLGVFVLCLISISYPELTHWWMTVLQKPAELAQAQALVVSGQPTAAPEESKQLVEAVAKIATGVMIGGIIFCAFVQVMLSRWWQGMLTAPGLLGSELATIRFSRLTGMLFALAVLASSVGELYPEFNNDLVDGIMPIVYMLFLIAGLNLVHYCFKLVSSKTKVFWMLFFYMFSIYMMPLSVVLIAMIALFDIWIDFRKRFPSV